MLALQIRFMLDFKENTCDSYCCMMQYKFNKSNGNCCPILKWLMVMMDDF